MALRTRELIESMQGDLTKQSKKIRKTILDMVYHAKASHVGSALSIADIVTYLYFSGRWCLHGPNIENRDSLILSKGHACVAIYSALYHLKILGDEEISSYGKDGSNLMHHISHKVDGVDFSTGSLGHGLPFTVGLAVADLINGENNTTRFCIIGDGELAEGSNWEAMLFSAHNRLRNITLIVDNNNMQSLGTVDDTMQLQPISDKFISFGWEVFNVDGHDFEKLHAAMTSKKNSKPKVIIAKTIKGKGVSFMENKVEWHYKNPSEQEYFDALSEIGRA